MSKEVKKTSNNNRPIVSILMLFGFLTILVTGLLSYVLRYSPLLSAVHTVFGLLFVGYGIFHLRNNLKSITQYLRLKRGRRWAWVSFLLIPLTVAALALGLPPFQTVIDAGYALKELTPIERQLTQTLYTRAGEQGKQLSIDIKAGEHYSGPGAVVLGIQLTGVPQLAVWAEDINGNYIETLYVTKSSSNSSYFGGLFSEEEVRRPEALPHWSHSRGIRSEDGLMMPSGTQPIADAMTGATPLSSFDLRTISSVDKDSLVIKLEVNRSFDFNQHYHAKAFPDDAVYSGSGASAQPSLIYAATVNLKSDERYYFMKLIGRGHHSGEDGEIHSDLAGITTAKEMIHRAIIEVL